MNVAEVLQAYQNTPGIFQIADRIAIASAENTTAPVPKIYLENLQGSTSQFVAAAVVTHPLTQELNHLFILNDAEEAAYFHNTLENLTGALDLFYFPSSFKNLPAGRHGMKNFSVLNSSHVMLRTEALMKASPQIPLPEERRDHVLKKHSVRRKIFVTYPEALFEKVALPQALNSKIIAIKTGESLSLDSVLLKLTDLGFERTDFVYEPGQFAIRGGILDIYSFGNEKPYRIELFGHEVESIRIIDPESQLSERKLSQVNIIPNIEVQLREDEKISLLDYLPVNTVVWMQDHDWCKEQLAELRDELNLYLMEKGEQGTRPRDQGTRDKGQGSGIREQDEADEKFTKKGVSEKDFITAEEFESKVFTRAVIGFGYSGSFPAQYSSFVIHFSTREQPAFNRRFDLLTNDLKKWEDKKYSIYIFAENSKQLQRLQSIFDDLDASIVFNPVAVSIHEGFIDEELKIVCYTDHQIFQRYHKYRVKQAYSRGKAMTLRMLRELHPGDYITHIDHGIGVYSGLQKITINGRQQEAVRLIYKDSDILYVNINSLHKIAKYTGKEGSIPRINKLGSDAWNRLKEKTKSRVKEIAFDLIKLYARRKAQQGFKHTTDTYLQTELEASFLFEDTPDQSKATADVKKDMESPSPMDRLICGDVGFGKTEVAIRAAFKTCVDGKQAAVLVPTTILAFQHYQTFKDRLKDFPVTIDYINRFRSAKEKKEVLEKLAAGKIDIIIGTHGLLGKEVIFKDLGLLIVDEEQKFGVAHKEKIKTLRTTVDCLTLTATPIPRTLQFSLMGARDLSIINTPPPNRQPIQTELITFNENIIRDAIYFETERGGQVFVIYNRIAGLTEMTALIRSLCPDLSVGYAHGQLEGHELEKSILDFINKRYDVLVCTNIVESGVDIPNVNTIIVNNAHQFGLSDLHQLRGRVGRSNKKAFCYLVSPPLRTLPDDSRKRLQTLEQHSELGSGFQIAMRDLDIRGAGNLLGGEQSGFMNDIGFEMYQKVLDEAIRELKRTEFKELFKEEISKQDDYVQDCTIDTDLEILIPDDYVESITERLSLYQRMDNCETDEELSQMKTELNDRFGPIPPQVEDLFITVQCRKIAVALGFEKIIMKDESAKFYFINRPDSPYYESEVFKKIISYMQTETHTVRLKQTGRSFSLIALEIKSMESLYQFLLNLHAFCVRR